MPGGFFYFEDAMSVEQFLDTILLLLVSIAAVNDLATRRIPNRLLLAGLGCALGLRLLSADPVSALLAAFGGMAAGLAMFLPFYLMRGMAAGDVKMIAVVGAFTGPGEVFQIAVLSWCAGGVMALLLVLLHGRLRLVLGNLGAMLREVMIPGGSLAGAPQQASAGSMPYGVAIAAGTLLVLVRHYG
jgi:prepilin peptidase CpaA